MVELACAHPAKFGDIVRAATGLDPELPGPLAGLADLPERLVEVPSSLDAVRAHVESIVGR